MKTNYNGIFNIVPKFDFENQEDLLHNYLLEDSKNIANIFNYCFKKSKYSNEYLHLDDFFSSKEFPSYFYYHTSANGLYKYQTADEEEVKNSVLAFADVFYEIIYPNLRDNILNVEDSHFGTYYFDFSRIIILVKRLVKALGYELNENSNSSHIILSHNLSIRNTLETEVVNSYYGYQTQLSLEKKKSILRSISVEIEKHKNVIHKYLGKYDKSRFTGIVNDKGDIRHYGGVQYTEEELHVIMNHAFNLAISMLDSAHSIANLTTKS